MVSSSNFPVAIVLTSVDFPAFYKPTIDNSNSLYQNKDFTQSTIFLKNIFISNNKNKFFFF